MTPFDRADPNLCTPRTQHEINILNAHRKFDKYFDLLLKLQGVYVAAVVLIPWQKWKYFETWWTTRQGDIKQKLVEIYQTYKDKYEEGLIDAAAAAEAQDSDNDDNYRPPVPELNNSLFDQHFNTGLYEHAIKDELDKYLTEHLADKTDWKGPLDWWKAHQKQYPILSKMAADILSIPGMSAEVERLFSSAKLMLPPARNSLMMDGIEASECISNWKKNGLF